MSTCPQCGERITYTLRLGGWAHVGNGGSVWCTNDPRAGSCVLGPVLGWARAPKP